MSLNHGTDQIQFASTETTIVGKLNGFKPELACHPLAANMNVWCLTAVIAIKIEAVRAWNAVNGGHAGGRRNSMTTGIRWNERIGGKLIADLSEENSEKSATLEFGFE